MLHHVVSRHLTPPAHPVAPSGRGPRRVRQALAAAGSVAATAALVIGAGAGPAAAATVAATTPANVGLFGAQDPTYDGVYRQSLSIIGLVATGRSPDAAAVNWLLAQQCTDGSFTAYRANTTVA